MGTASWPNKSVAVKEFKFYLLRIAPTQQQSPRHPRDRGHTQTLTPSAPRCPLVSEQGTSEGRRACAGCDQVAAARDRLR